MALEVVDFDRPLDDVEDVIAHNIFQRAVAFGELVEPVEPGEAVFSVNGEERARVSQYEPPADTLAFVARFLGEAGAGLAPGDRVIAGALAPPTPVSPGDVAALTVAGIGTVELRFSRES